MEKYDIIIQGGQSNAEGTGRGKVFKEYEPNDRIMYMTQDKKVEHLPEGVKITYYDEPFVFSVANERGEGNGKTGDFALTFAEEYVKSGMLEEGRKLLIIRGGIGGTGFKKGNWRKGDAVFNKLLEMTDFALGLHAENRVVAFLWHQGEHDAFERNEPQVFESQLVEILTEIRNRYDNNLPFIAGDFVSEWKQENIELCKPIVEKIKTVASGKNGAFVETGDLLSNNQQNGDGDTIHFSRQSLHELGRRYFQAFKEIKERKKRCPC